jgi:hypothetical protein
MGILHALSPAIFLYIFVDAHHPLAQVSQARPRHQPDVATPDDPYPETFTHHDLSDNTRRAA